MLMSCPYIVNLSLYSAKGERHNIEKVLTEFICEGDLLVCITIGPIDDVSRFLNKQTKNYRQYEKGAYY